ncbi:MAG: glycoside hydrolase family 88 protein [Bryobacteraceae bacterium]|nr:glycoside hydrolase family 88 protein [Bryobacteraceae bacterium]
MEFAIESAAGDPMRERPLLNRRDILALAAASAASAQGNANRLPRGVGAIVSSSLRLEPSAVNTDWFGTVLMEGLLRWRARGVEEVRPFARAWLDHHLQSGSVARYSGPKSRIFQAGGIPMTTYAGHYGLALPCDEMARQFGDDRARRVVIGVAAVILHHAARNHLGLAAHDDGARFAIPDTCFFVAEALMRAWRLEPASGTAFLDHAVYQLRAYIDAFLIRETGLARTILEDGKLGNTYWTRASGWLLWAITAVLRHLPPHHAEYPRFLKDLRALAGGMARVQDAGGGFHVLLDEPATPLETTGAAMFAMGAHEGVRRGWLDASYRPAIERAWGFVQGNITDEGKIRNAYTGWAVPAERREIDDEMDRHDMGWIPGFILRTSDELASG